MMPRCLIEWLSSIAKDLSLHVFYFRIFFLMHLRILLQKHQQETVTQFCSRQEAGKHTGYVAELVSAAERGVGGCGREKSPNEVRNDVMLLYTLSLLFSSSSTILSSYFLFFCLLLLLLTLTGPISINPCYFLMQVSVCNVNDICPFCTSDWYLALHFG